MDPLWAGPRQIVVGFDIGTTQSAVTHAYLYPGGPTTPRRVTRWPGQESQKGEVKIPSVLWYDQRRTARSFGAEALLHETEDLAEGEGWELVRHFKIHLHPETIRAKHDLKVEPLPDNLSIRQIYADFLKYLFQHTQSFFKESTIDGNSVWNELRDSIIFIMAHPNGWDLKEQAVLRGAALEAKLVSSPDQAEEKVLFVTEAEAAVHFILCKSDIGRSFQPGTDLVVCDAGGSTVDITLYEVESMDPKVQLKEKKASACVQAGAIFVNEFAKAHFRHIFSNAKKVKHTELEEFLSEVMSNFENDTKKSFQFNSEDKNIRVGPHGLSDLSLGIKRGRMMLTGKQIETFFSPCVAQILGAVRSQIEGHEPQYLLLVGGFGDSPYLWNRVKAEFGDRMQVIIANDAAAKAVSDGTIAWFVKQVVKARATRYAFGLRVAEICTEEVARSHGRKLVRTNEGDWICGCWMQVVPKGLIANVDYEISSEFAYHTQGPNRPTLTRFHKVLYACDLDTTPVFLYDENYTEKDDGVGGTTVLFGSLLPGMREVCTIVADLSPLEPYLKVQTGLRGLYWRVEYKLALRFGLTSLKAFIVWGEKDEHRGPANLVPADFH